MCHHRTRREQGAFAGATSVDREEAKVKFQDADRLFQSKHFDEALRVLTDLNRAFPNERHVLYPLARCLTGLKRYPEAREVSERLVKEFRYMPAQELVDRIDRLQAFDDPDVQTPVLPSGLDDIMRTPSSFGGSQPQKPATSAGSGWQPYVLWISLVFLGFIALVGVTLTLGRPVIDYYIDYVENLDKYASDPDSVPSVPFGPYLIVTFASYAYSWVVSSLCGYVAIRIVGALRYDDFGEDMKDVGLYTFYFFLINLLPGLLILVAGEYVDPEQNMGTLFALFGLALFLMLIGWIVNPGIAEVPLGTDDRQIVRGRPAVWSVRHYGIGGIRYRLLRHNYSRCSFGLNRELYR